MDYTTVQYDVDGLTMINRLFVDRSRPGKRPGVLVFPEATGLGDHACASAERLAGLGYAALACDLLGGGQVVSITEAGAAVAPLFRDPQRVRVRTKAALKALVEQDDVDRSKVAAIGYCFGGSMALELARSGADLAATVGFHCHLPTANPPARGDITGKVLVSVGADDPTITPADRAGFEAEMRTAGAQWQLNIYGGVVHSFTNREADAMGNPEFARYDRTADEHSWADMLRLFGEVFGSEPR